MRPIPRLVVAYDFSEPSRRAFELAVFLGRQLDAEVHVLTVLDGPEADSGMATQELDDLRELLEVQTRETVEAGDVRIRCHAVKGDPAAAIIKAAQEIEAPLIVCGTTGKGAVARTLLGSVSYELIHKSRAIVMSVP